MGSVVLFADMNGDCAAVYLHGDDGDVPEQLDAFFAQEEALQGPLSGNRYTNRFDDPEYLAARFVVYAATPTGDGVGVTSLDNRDETNYRVLCANESRPGVVHLDHDD